MEPKATGMADRVLVEVAVESLAHALKAEDLGADRIELCSSLGSGGLTPSYGLVKACTERLSIPVHVMIRCRPGGFYYTAHEMEVMLNDARKYAELGAAGLVFGFLDKSYHLDFAKTETFSRLCSDNKINSTFHRAIDLTPDPISMIGELMELGIRNVLTSGSRPRAIEGGAALSAYIEKYNDEITIIAGSGINGDNVNQILDLGIKAVHLTSHKYCAIKALSQAVELGPEIRFDHDKLKSVLDAVGSR